jgi:formylglycine-generating enzyme required for sulfatase activity
MNDSQVCPSTGDLGAYSRGELGGEQRAFIEEHLKRCAVCSRALTISSAVVQTHVGFKAQTPAHSTYNPQVSGLPEEATAIEAAPMEKDRSAELKAILGLLQPAQENDELGRTSGYRLLKHIGTGGMGTVFRAEDLMLRRPVALKIMKPETQSNEGWARLQREARSMAAIKHEHLATVYGAGREGEVFFLAMELLEGKPLDQWMKTATPSAAEILRIAREIAVGLAAIHKHGLIHRDIKPSNIWVEAPNDKIKILDFGLARPMTVQGSTFVTQPEMMAGTPAFMSPEQARGGTLDARSDLFSFGGVLYCLCTGRTPFSGDVLIAQLTSLAVDTPEPVSKLNAKIPLGLSDLIDQLLRKEADQRPQSAEEVIAKLDAMGITSTTVRAAGAAKEVPATEFESGKSKRWLVAVLLLALLGTAGFFLLPKPEPQKSPVVANPEKPPVVVIPEKPPEKIVTPPTPPPVTPPKVELPKEIVVELEDTKMVLLLVPAGEFMMGSEKGDPHERPAHKVKISKPYYIAKYETTVAQFRALVKSTGYVSEAEKRGKAFPVIDGKFEERPGVNWRDPGFKQGDDHPVCVVTWNDAQAFCNWASGRLPPTLPPLPDGKWVVRLPTEAEWEYAARGPQNLVFPWGDIWGVRANVADASLKATGYPMKWGEIKEDDGFATTAPGGSFKNASWVGAFDMAGNVWEWCQDHHTRESYVNAAEVDPTGAPESPTRIMRGGCWDSPLTGVTGFKRGYQAPNYPSGNIGFRVVVGRKN